MPEATTVDTFDILAAWPAAVEPVSAGAVADELGVDTKVVADLLNDMAQTGAIIAEGGQQYSLTTYGSILASCDDGGRSLGEGSA